MHDIQRVPPADIDTERVVLGAMMLAAESAVAIPTVMEVLEMDDFYRNGHQLIFDAIDDLFAEGTPVDLTTVTSCLQRKLNLEKVGGVPYLDEMIESVPTAANVEHYAQIVKNLSTRRKAIYVGQQIHNLGFDDALTVDELLEDTEGLIQRLRNGGTNKVHHVKHALKETFSNIDAVFKGDKTTLGIPTGFIDLDELLSGLKNGEYIFIAARPGMGKSTLIQNMIQHMCIKNGLPTLLFSPEMDSGSIVLRLLSAEAGINMQFLRTGKLREVEWPRLTIAAGKISAAPLLIDDTTGIKMHEIRSKAHNAVAQHGVGLICLDYIQLIADSKVNRSRNDELGEISGGLKALGRELKVPIVVASQLSREVERRTPPRPKLSDLRESGNLEQDADVVIFIYRQSYYETHIKDSVSELIVAKQRNGPTGTVKVLHDLPMMCFRNLEKGAAWGKSY